MSRLVRDPRLKRLVQLVTGLVVGVAGGAALSAVTSQGYLHAAVVTGAGYTGEAKPVGPEAQLLMLLAWVLVGAVAGYLGRSLAAFAGLWAGAFAGSALGFLADPVGNILWLDVVVTVVGISLFVTPGFFIGSALAGRRERNLPDGSGTRPAPPPLWARGSWGGHRPSAVAVSRDPEAVTAGKRANTEMSPAWARPGSAGPSAAPPPTAQPPYAPPASGQPDRQRSV